MVVVTYLEKLYRLSRTLTYPRTIAYVTNTKTDMVAGPFPTQKRQEERPLRHFLVKQTVKCLHTSRLGLIIARPQNCTTGDIKAPPRI